MCVQARVHVIIFIVSLCSDEIQLEEHCRSKGLGKFLLQILELLCHR